MRFSLKESWSFLKEMFQAYSDDDCFTLGAALSYYTVFSLAPILIIIIALVGFIFGPDAVRGEIYHQLDGLLGPENAAQIQSLVRNAYQSQSGIVATVIGIITLVFGATGVFTQLKKSLNIVWQMKAEAKSGILRFALDRLVSFAMVVAIGFVLLVALVVEALAASLSDYLEQLIPAFSGPLVVTVNFAITLVLTSLIFACIYKFLPDAKVRWSDVMVGSLVTSLLFALGRLGIGLYLSKSNVGETFGAAGFLVVLLTWVYYSSQILFLGAEFTYVYARRYGSGIQPSANAVKVERNEVEVPDESPQA
ncbi:membrane protein [Catalinimonas alkaloidigena]|uniref:Membrane protein n=1 Tax=Catalinimonas alkaloidigena TaxID=1075417 RepID=A0A1G9A9M9_9BACT|nr:YihY/virulence factor BrkB family protein [Catalinimonas alkaloidigena]SDK23961.1 membrane protein [Catalinimonas alkaloidigena]